MWERKTQTIVNALVGDVSIVNCLQPHPTSCLIASSGIDPVVRLWSPMPEVIIHTVDISPCCNCHFMSLAGRYRKYSSS